MSNQPPGGAESFTDACCSPDEAFDDPKLADIFDRYSQALDLGDQAAADLVLAEHPEIDDAFRLPLRGLYLLGAEARQRSALQTERSDEQPRRIGDFELREELGRGGMGVVYRARQVSLQRNVALKILPFTAVLDPRQVSRFQHEAQAAASLHHPNIVPVYCVGCERGVHYYSMQLIEGQTLAEFIKQRLDAQSHVTAKTAATGRETDQAQLSTVASIDSKHYVDQVVQLIATVARALHFAHEQGIVHRDIKPSNLLIDNSGKPWIADFGLARGRASANLTSAGDQLGTLRYMSPEQAAGRNHEVSFRSDIYSLGVTLYELLTLSPARPESDRMKLLTAIQNEPPVIPTVLRSLNQSIPQDLEIVLEKAVEKLSADRYESAASLADDLDAVLNGHAILAKRKTKFERTYSSLVKNKRLVGAVAACLVAACCIAVAVAGTFYQQRQRELEAGNKARFYLQQAHKSVDRFGASLADQLAETPGTDSLRADLLGEAIGYYDDFLKFADETSDLEFERAQAQIQLAILHHRMGEDTTAVESYRSALTSLAELQHHPEAAFEIAVCQNELGLLYKRNGDLVRSASAFDAALSTFDSLQEPTKRLPETRAAIAQTIANIGMVRWSNGDLPGAVSQFEGALAQLGDQAVTDHQNDAIRSVYFKIKGSYIVVLQDLDPDRAKAVLTQSINALIQANESLRANALSNETPLTGSFASSNQTMIAKNNAHIADMRNNLAAVLSKSKKFDEARNLAQSVVDYWTLRLEQSPLDTTVAQRLATAYNTLGEIQWQSKSDGLGDRSFAEAEKLLRKVTRALPNRPAALSRLAGVLHNRSLVAYRFQHLDSAAAMIRQAIELQTTARNLAPSNVRYETLLGSHQRTLKVFQGDRPVASQAGLDAATGSKLSAIENPGR